MQAFSGSHAVIDTKILFVGGPFLEAYYYIVYTRTIEMRAKMDITQLEYAVSRNLSLNAKINSTCLVIFYVFIAIC